MNSSGTSSENLQHLTVLSVTMKTRHARTVAKLDTESMIAPRSKTSPPISFAVSVEMPATWPETVPIDKRAPAGGTTALVLLAVLAAEMVLTVNTR